MNAIKLGNAVAELSFYGIRSLRDLYENHGIQRRRFDATFGRIQTLCDKLGIKLPKNVSHDEHDAVSLIEYFDACLEAFQRKVRLAYQVGKEIGSIQAVRIPTFILFNRLGAFNDADDMLSGAEEALNSLKSNWSELFGQTHDLSTFSKMIKSLKDQPHNNWTSIDEMAGRLDTETERILDVFERL